ncbi:SDR family NAD(P)-dependent oxidoreductase [Phreatobacter sp.]|uniref:SDR family NAD(P)-dependent oxidoreductase n=1 Tax=Phreatobacter sp. TaxID=1966341 RepID=UPI0025F4C914|nr:SDR family NAD(P)-dependent oxidoreductase [Phreatobacter sp.]
MRTPEPAALVTGGSRGIGAAIVRKLLARGLKVVILDREAPAEPSAARFVQCDLTDLASTQAALAAISAENAILWLVNNAGIAAPATLEDTTMEDFDKVVAINLRACILAAQAALSAMKAAGKGRIVTISSRAALGKELRTAYSATKAGVIGLTRTWALELAPHGITVNAIGPGPIETELFKSANPHNSPRTQAIIRGVPVQRLGQPEDIAHAADFFLSEGASFVTGQVLYVCGGMTVGVAPI